MSTTKNLGIVSCVPMGTWTASTTYKKLNIVEHEHVSYIVTKTCKGVEPNVTSGWEDYYMQILTSLEAVQAAEKSEAAMEVVVEKADLIDEVVSNEAARQSAESSRVSAESARVTEYNSLITGLSAKLSEMETELADIKEAIEALNSGDGIQIYYDEDGRLSYDYTE